MNKKLRVGILFGGRSAEHTISAMSAKNVVNGLDRAKYEISLIGIDKKGMWYLQEPWPTNLHLQPKELHVTTHIYQRVTLIPGARHGLLLNLSNTENITAIDVMFPVLHGPFGEDGTIQSVLKIANMPFVGSSVLGSAVCMDKDVMKRLLRDAGLPIAKFITIKRHQLDAISEDEIIKNLGLPCFVKPANLGSSIGMSKVKTKQELRPALELAFEYDNKIIIEEAITGREIECSVLGNEELRASWPGEIIPHHEFYTYEAKYFDAHGADLISKADMPKDIAKKIQELAKKAFEVLECQGMARVDFFLDTNNNIFINELNTIPGFTNISQYPQMWQASGLGYSELLDQLISLALAHHDKEQNLKTEP